MTKPEKKTVRTKQPASKKATATADGQLSAIDAAARVLGTAKEPLSCKALIETMAAKKYWTSPGGKTPQATLYAAILREISTKGKESRFKKTDPGRFTLTTTK